MKMDIFSMYIYIETHTHVYIINHNCIAQRTFETLTGSNMLWLFTIIGAMPYSHILYATIIIHNITKITQN